MDNPIRKPMYASDQAAPSEQVAEFLVGLKPILTVNPGPLYDLLRRPPVVSKGHIQVAVPSGEGLTIVQQAVHKIRLDKAEAFFVYWEADAQPQLLFAKDEASLSSFLKAFYAPHSSDRTRELGRLFGYSPDAVEAFIGSDVERDCPCAYCKGNQHG